MAMEKMYDRIPKIRPAIENDPAQFHIPGSFFDDAW
jgi:hypothetical protein